MTRRVSRWCRVCGWKGTYDSAARADYSKRQHSCAKHLARAAAAERGRERAAGVDRTPKPCLHKVTHHEHGTRACYVLDRCRCLPCANANTRMAQQRARAQAYGRYNRYATAEETDQARAHIRSLSAAGMGLKRIVATTEISQGLLWKLMYGKRRADGARQPTKRIQRTSYDQIMAIKVDLADGAKVPGRPTVLRMRALVALGWSQAKLAHRLGISTSNFHLARGTEHVHADTARQAAALYDELSMTLPPNETHRERISVSRAKTYAAKHGWLPPLALDDDQLDDPTYTPPSQRVMAARAKSQIGADETLIERILSENASRDTAQSATKDERVEVVRRVLASGRSLTRLAAQTGWKVERYYVPAGRAERSAS